MTELYASLPAKELKRIRNILETEIRSMETTGVTDTLEFNSKIKLLEEVRTRLTQKC
jgi:hypothetical protein